MKYEKLPLIGLVLFTPEKIEDERGYFLESFRHSIFFEATNENSKFVQDNQSFSKLAGTLRGLNYQCPPHAQGKLVKCSQGSIIDISLDVRSGSKTFGQYVSVELSAENGCHLWIPPGFLHGFITQFNDTMVHYKCTSYYNPQSERSVIWNDKDLSINWGLNGKLPILSDKDRNAYSFAEFVSIQKK